MSWQTSALSNATPVPWRNGGGITRELATYPRTGPWQWRISVADVASNGPFSRFEGVHRWFAVLSGAGVLLDVGGVVHRLGPNDGSIDFSGQTPVDCQLMGGSTLDFNLMCHGCTADLHRVREPHALTVSTQTTVGVFALSASSLGCNDRVVPLPAQTLAWHLPDTDCVWQLHTTHALVFQITVD